MGRGSSALIDLSLLEKENDNGKMIFKCLVLYSKSMHVEHLE